MSLLKDKINHQKIANEMSPWSFSDSDFAIHDQLESDSNIKISENTLITGDVNVAGQIKLAENCFFIVCGKLKANDFLTGYGCTTYLNSVQIERLFNAVQTSAVTAIFSDSSAKYVTSGHSMGKITLFDGTLKADIIDDYVECKNDAKLDFDHNDLIKFQFPDYLSEDDWGNGDEEFHRKKAHLLGIDNASELNEDELCNAGFEIFLKKGDEKNIFDAIEGIIKS